MHDVDELVGRALADIEASEDLVTLDAIRVKFLGRKGDLTARAKQLSELDPADRPAAGQAINRAKEALRKAIDAKRTTLEGCTSVARATWASRAIS